MADITSHTAVEVEAVRPGSFVVDVAPAAQRNALWIDAAGTGSEVLKGMADIRERVSLVRVDVETRAFWEGQQFANDVSLLMSDWSFVEGGRGKARLRYHLVFVTGEILARAPMAVKLATVAAALAASVEPVLPRR